MLKAGKAFCFILQLLNFDYNITNPKKFKKAHNIQAYLVNNEEFI